MLRVVSSIALIVVGGLVACTTFNDLQADASLVPNPTGKNSGAECTTDNDCKSLSCTKNKCGAVAGANPTNGKKDGDETDVDCGGASAPPCSDGNSCATDEDCASASCNASKICKAPAPDDNIKNADETDVDCGGTKAPKCGSGKGCAADSDCSVGGCNYAKKCVDFPSCVGHEGGDTCGQGETGAAGAVHESCCTTIKDGNISIGKYYVTSGRVRAFVTKFNGDLKKWASTNPKGWNDAWTDELPESMDEALGALGPGNKRGCSVSEDGQGARTYWQPPIPDFRPDEKQDFDQKVLDEKIQNCIPWVIAQAICHYDGGRIATAQEIEDQITNHGTTKNPWGNSPAFPPNKDAPGIEQMSHNFSYATPNPPANLRGGPGGVDHAYYIPPPGRTHAGHNNIGVEDAAGAMLAWTGDKRNTFAWTGSWENHGIMGQRIDGSNYPNGPQPWPTPGSSDFNDVQDGYYGIGVRCAFDK